MTAANGNDFVSEIICLVLLVAMIVLFIRVIVDWVRWRVGAHRTPGRSGRRST